MSLVIQFLIGVLTLVLVKYFWEWRKKLQISKQFPGPPGVLPFIGNLASIPFDPIEIFRVLSTYNSIYGKNYAFWGLGLDWRIVITDVNDLETILASNKLTKKGLEYDLIVPWLGNGLITGNGMKWFQHRRIITPTFHFGILQQFLETFNQQTAILVDKFSVHENADEFDIEPYIKCCTLDVINETAMGVRINAQNGEHADYVKAVHVAGMYVYDKMFTLAGQIPLLWYLSQKARKEKHALKILHDFTNSVIRSKKAELAIAGGDNNEVSEDSFGQKKKTTFLELLLKSTIDGKPLTDEEIREEVDTFMFAGHDTTTNGIGFTLYHLSRHPEIQERLYQEIVSGIGTDSSTPITYNSLQELKYLDMVIKESMRKTPPVPLITRMLIEDTIIGGVNVPAFTNIHLPIFALHNDKENFPNPEIFDPERFSPENSENRHPYSYIPFSAGQRNCIGQKYAMLEIKTVISRLLQRYKLLPGKAEYHIRFQADLVLRSADGWNLKIVSRI